MVTNASLKIPVVGDFVKHVREGNSYEIAKDALRVSAAAVAIIAFGVFPSITARIVSIPYIGSLFLRFQALTPVTQIACVSLVSVSSLALTGGVALMASAVTTLVRAHMALNVITCLDVLSKLFTGGLLFRYYRQIQFGGIELAVNEAKRTSVQVKETVVPVPHVQVKPEVVSVPIVQHENSTATASA